MSFLAVDLASVNKGVHLNDIPIQETLVVCCRASIGTSSDSMFGTWLNQHLENPDARYFGAYHVVTNHNPKDQLYIYQSTVKDFSELWPVLDIERSDLRTDNLRATVDTFLKEYERVVIYTYQSYITEERFKGYEKLPLWIAYYPKILPAKVLDGDASTAPIAPIPRCVWKKATLWQLNGNDTPTSQFKVNGIDVDLSVGYDLNGITRIGLGA